MIKGTRGIALALIVFASATFAETSAWTLFQDGLKEFKKKRYDRAERLFDAAVNKDARCQDAYYYLGRLNEKRGKFREAVAAYEQVTDKVAAYPMACERLGHFAMRGGDKKKAAELFRVYAESNPSVNSYMQLANAELGAKEFKEAEVTLGKAAKLSAGDLNIVEMQGRLYMETERYPEALDCYSKIVRQIPRDSTAHYLRGLCLMNLDRGPEALREWEANLKIDPYHGLTLRSLIGAYGKDRKYSRKVAEYQVRLKRLAKTPPPSRSRR